MRIASIDILRALTMLLMIWVNDFWTLVDIPKWLEHASATEDYLGFSDIIFPLFLFIVGLSIPLAFQNRLDRNESKRKLVSHILIRSFSLLLMGVYMVNLETAHGESIYIGKNYWGLLMATAMVLIWMNWSRSPVPKKWHKVFQATGWVILLYLAVIYKGGSDGESWMRTQWWGILGLIGWAYLFNALVYLFTKGKLKWMFAFWIFLVGLSVLSFTDYALKDMGYLRMFSTLYSGTVPAFTAGGIVATLIFRQMAKKNLNQVYLIIAVLGVISLIFGIMTRPIWGISKIQGTPSWLAICTGIGFLSFLVLYYIADIKGKVNWAKIIGPAGTATLTCYLIPYFVYPIRSLTGIRLPEVLNTSWLGLTGSLVFALLVVLLTGFFEKKGYKLKL